LGVDSHIESPGFKGQVTLDGVEAKINEVGQDEN